MPSRRIAIVGAGPVGLEAALYGASLGHDVQVYDRGRVGENMRSWGHVTLFSGWELNHSPLGQRVLETTGARPLAPESVLTGREHVTHYLEALAGCDLLRGRVQQDTRVSGIGRERIGKGDKLGGGREEHPFRLLLEHEGVERFAIADVVLDCSGTYGNHNWLGNGNLPAIGERQLGHRIDYTLLDIGGTERTNLEGARVLLVGTGYSAATALTSLIDLSEIHVTWVGRVEGLRPYRSIPGDPLPQRAALAKLGNRLATGMDDRVEYLAATHVERIAETTLGTLEVSLVHPSGASTVTVDRILAHVGYFPDNSLYRQLQFHECYASSGPMRLAATLLKNDTGDCLAQSSGGPELLRNPEPDFYVLGSKSYGRNSDFLIRVGIEQVRDVYSLIDDRSDLNLYTTSRESIR